MVHQFETSHSIRKMMNKHSSMSAVTDTDAFQSRDFEGCADNNNIQFKNNWIDHQHLQVKINFWKINKYIIVLNWKRNCNVYVICFQNAEYKTT